MLKLIVGTKHCKRGFFLVVLIKERSADTIYNRLFEVLDKYLSVPGEDGIKLLELLHADIESAGTVGDLIIAVVDPFYGCCPALPLLFSCL